MRLTKDEIILIASILLALSVGAAVKHYRDQHRPVAPPTISAPEAKEE